MKLPSPFELIDRGLQWVVNRLVWRLMAMCGWTKSRARLLLHDVGVVVLAASAPVLAAENRWGMSAFVVCASAIGWWSRDYDYERDLKAENAGMLGEPDGARWMALFFVAMDSIAVASESGGLHRLFYEMCVAFFVAQVCHAWARSTPPTPPALKLAKLAEAPQ